MRGAPWCRIPALISLHGLAFASIYLIAYVIRYDGFVPLALWDSALAALPLVVGLKLAPYVALGGHRGWWRSATFADLAGQAEVVTLGSAIVASACFLSHGRWAIPRSVLLIDWAATMVALCGVRGAARLLRERYGPFWSTRPLSRVLVVGADDAGEAVVRQIAARPRLGLKVIGILDPDRGSHGRMLAGVPVLGTPDDLARIADRRRVETVLIPTPAVPPREIRALVQACGEARLKAQVVPGFDALLTGAVSVQPRDVDIPDLLGRAPVQLDKGAIGRFLAGRVVMVTGAAGSIGSELCRQILAIGPARLLLVDHNENGLFYLERGLRELAPAIEAVPCVAGIADAPRLRALFRQHQPHVVFHAAAHKHVPMMESNPGEAVKNNVFGTRTVVDESLRAGVEAFVMISTDKAVNPTSVMGACKRLAESYVQALSGSTGTRVVTVRFGNVLGSAGSVVPIFKEQIRAGGPVTVTHPDVTRYFMTIPEAAQLVLQSGALGRGGEIFVLDMGEPVKLVDLARDLIRLSGQAAGEGIDIVFTGLRPGEKLYEELYDDAEELLATPHPKIRVARHRPCPVDPLLDGFDRLAEAVNGPPDRVVAALRDMVPGYRSSPPPHARGPVANVHAAAS